MSPEDMMILQPISDQTLSGGLSLGSQQLLYQLPGAALRGGRTSAVVLVLTHPPLSYPACLLGSLPLLPPREPPRAGLGPWSPALDEAQDQRATNHHAAGRQPRGSCPWSPCCVGLTAGLPAAWWERGSTVEEG